MSRGDWLLREIASPTRRLFQEAVRVERFTRAARASVSDADLAHPSAEWTLIAMQSFEALCSAIDTLPMKQQQVLAMSLYHGMIYVGFETSL